MTDPHAFKYDIALSFAGEDRPYVSAVASALVNAGVPVFYDEYEVATLWGKDLYTHLRDVYQNQARFTVLFASKHYAAKVWTSHERESAQARAIKERTEYILPVRFDDSSIPGLLPTTGYIDLRKTTPEQLVDLILKKLGRRAGSWEGDESTPLPGEARPREESLRERQARLADQKEAREERARFRDSRGGADLAQQQADEMFSYIKKEVSAFCEKDSALEIRVVINSQRVLLVASARGSFTMHLGQNPPNLFTQEFDGPYSLTSFGPRNREPVRATHVAFDVDEAMRPVWKDSDSPDIALSTQQLADRYLSRVIERAYALVDKSEIDLDWDD